MRRTLLIIGIMLRPAFGLAQEVEGTSGGSQPALIWIILQAILALALVIGGIFLVVWVLKQAMNRGGGMAGGSGGRLFGVVHRTTISPKQSIYAVRFQDDLFILAGNDERLSVIHHYSGFEAWDQFDTGASGAGSNFAEVLKEKFLHANSRTSGERRNS